MARQSEWLFFAACSGAAFDWRAGCGRLGRSFVRDGAAAIAFHVHLQDRAEVDEPARGGERDGLAGEQLALFSQWLAGRDHTFLDWGDLERRRDTIFLALWPISSRSGDRRHAGPAIHHPGSTVDPDPGQGPTAGVPTVGV
jgi:hypothetical protein